MQQDIHLVVLGQDEIHRIKRPGLARVRQVEAKRVIALAEVPDGLAKRCSSCQRTVDENDRLELRVEYVALDVDFQSGWQRDYLLVDGHGVSPASARGKRNSIRRSRNGT
jgi:hypothetical protein